MVAAGYTMGLSTLILKFTSLLTPALTSRLTGAVWSCCKTGDSIRAPSQAYHRLVVWVAEGEVLAQAVVGPILPL